MTNNRTDNIEVDMVVHTKITIIYNVPIIPNMWPSSSPDLNPWRVIQRESNEWSHIVKDLLKY